ncbi:hypothetical protein ES707_09592 [subsurface metagenome]
MPHGTPDWGLVGPKSTVYGLDDLGEHAVRLGSPHLWDRLGDLLWQTTFAHGLGDVTLMVAIAGSSVHLHTGYARQGAFCAQLTEPDIALANAYIQKHLPLPVTSRVGIECSFSFDDDLLYFGVGFTGNNGALTFEAYARYDHQNGRLEYEDNLGVYQLITDDFYLREFFDDTHVMKLVVDFFSEEYVRVIVDDQTFLLTGIAYRTFGVPANTLLIASVRGEPDAGKIAVSQDQP